jgi:hypothetical protein
MERRNRGSGQVTHVACRNCSAPVLLDPTRIRAKAARVELRCPACGAPVPVRHDDPARVTSMVNSDTRDESPPQRKLGMFKRKVKSR